MWRCDRRIADVQTWGSFAEEELLDRRKTGPFNGRGSLIAAATAALKPTWETGSAAEVQAAMTAWRTIGGVTHTAQDTRTRREWWPAIVLFLFAMAVFIAREASTIREVTTFGAGVLFAGLTGLTMALSVTAWRERLRTRWQAVNVLAVPLTITAAIAIYCGVVGLPIAQRAAAFGAYLTLPAVLVCAGRAGALGLVRVLAAAIVLWLPIEFHLLPQLQLPPPDGLRAAPFAALAAGLYLFLVACPLDRIGYTFQLSRRDLRLAVIATAAFAIVGLPIGLATGFLQWNPRLDAVRLAAAPLAIYLATGVPEEFLFRGLIQNALERAIGRAALPIASIIFGLAHLPDVRYVLLATLAGVAYGWVYQSTRRITASAVTHALVDWIWVLLLRG